MDTELTAEEMELLAAWREGNLGAMLTSVAKRVNHGAVQRGVAAGKVFWSHANTDPLAREVANELRRAGDPVWLDKHELHAGELYDGVIEEAARSCAGMVLFLKDVPTPYQFLEFSHAKRHGKDPLVVKRPGGPELDKRYTAAAQLCPWPLSATAARGIRESGLGQWIEKAVADPGPQRTLIDDILGLTRSALGDHSDSTVTGTAWFPDTRAKRSVSAATAGMQDVAWAMLAVGRSNWVPNVNLEHETLEDRASLTLNALVHAADPRYRDRFTELVQRCRARGLSEPSMLRAFAVAHRLGNANE